MVYRNLFRIMKSKEDVFVKKRIVLVVTALALVALLVGATAVMAAKPQKSGSGKDVIALSNGFPSGPHETLNIHGKKADYQCVECVPIPGEVQCNVVNIPEYTTNGVKISYVSGRKVKIDELTVFDSCAGFDQPGQEDGAEVWLPYEPEGYWVFARALGKPAKGDPNDSSYEPRRIIFQNDENSPVAYSLFGNVTNPDEVPLVFPLGVITKNGAYKVMSTNELGEYLLVRFDSEPVGRGKGKNVGKDITDMFMWSGWVFHGSLDLNGDGVVNELDVIADSCPYDADQSGTINSTEVATWASDHLDPDDVNGDTFVNELDVIIDSCPYDTSPPDGFIDGDEFQDWLDDNIEGWVFPPSLDLNGDGVVNELDVIADSCPYDADQSGTINSTEAATWASDHLDPDDVNGDTFVDELDVIIDSCPYDIDGNGVIDPWDEDYDEADEFESWLEDKIPGDQTEADFYVTLLWEHYETPVWVFTIADLVYHNQIVINEGIKNLQIRFYPVATTEFERKNRIVVDKVTDPPGSTRSFDFMLDGPGGFHAEFSLTDEASPYTSIHLQPGEYTVTETVPTGWDVTDIVPDDDDSTGNPGAATATINLKAGEIVTVAFTNTEQS
jgi:hypothetical protein